MNGQEYVKALQVQWFFLNEICMDRIVAGEEILLELGWVKEPNWECLFVHRNTGLFLSVYVDHIKMAGKEAEYGSMKNVDLDEPTSFLDHVCLECTQRECKPNEIIIEECTKMFESRISAGATKKLPGWEKPDAKTVAWSYDMEGHAQTCAERYCELAKQKSGSRSPKFQVPAWMITWSNRKSLNQLENYHMYAHILIWNACTWHELVDQPYYGLSINLQEQSQNNSGLRQTIGKMDSVHSSHQWLPTILSCGKHGSALSTGFIPRLRHCWRPWGFEITFG